MKFWPFPIIRNHSTSRGLSDLFETLAAQPDLRVTQPDDFRATVSCSLGTMTFWSANAYYAWAQEGEWHPTGGARMRWCGVMPSRWAVREMSWALDRVRFAPFPEAA